MIPKRVKEELDGAKVYFDFKERCVYCDILRQETSAGVRVVTETDRLMVLQPWAPRFPFETWILPKRHESHFEQTEDATLQNLAWVLRSTLRKIDKVLEHPPLQLHRAQRAAAGESPGALSLAHRNHSQADQGGGIRMGHGLLHQSRRRRRSRRSSCGNRGWREPPAADAETAPHRRILAIVIALILYGSLYPWQFHARHYGRKPALDSAARLARRGFDRYLVWDVAVNVTLYLPLGIFALSVGERAAPRACCGFWRRWRWRLVLSASHRDAAAFRRFADVQPFRCGFQRGGRGGGHRGRRALSRTLQRFLAAQGAGFPAAPIGGRCCCLSCWLGYQLFPLFPVWGRTNLFAQADGAVATASSLSPVDTLVVFAEWLTVACLLESIRKTQGQRSAGAAVAAGAGALDHCQPHAGVAGYRGRGRRVCGVVVPAAALGAAGDAGAAGGRADPGRVCAISLAARAGLQLGAVPRMFRSAWQDGLVVLFRKSFWYGSVLWLWRGVGTEPGVDDGGRPPAALFLLERAQVYLPGRTPEITDAVLAVLMGVLLWLLRDA